jgi:hypothetical protein
VIADLADEPGLLALTFPVDYWDYLGWADTLAKPEFTARQEAHKQTLKLRALRTPQVVVDGGAQADGFSAPAVRELAGAERRRGPPGPNVAVQSRAGLVLVRGAKAPRGGADVWLVRYDPRLQTVTVTSGENRGRVVPHRNVVRELVRLGGWYGRDRSFRLPAARASGLRTAVLVQSRRDGRILGADQG